MVDFSCVGKSGVGSIDKKTKCATHLKFQIRDHPLYSNKIEDGGDIIKYAMPRMESHRKLLRNSYDKNSDIHVKTFVPYQSDNYLGKYRISHLNQDRAVLCRVAKF